MEKKIPEISIRTNVCRHACCLAGAHLPIDRRPNNGRRTTDESRRVTAETGPDPSVPGRGRSLRPVRGRSSGPDPFRLGTALCLPPSGPVRARTVRAMRAGRAGGGQAGADRLSRPARDSSRSSRFSRRDHSPCPGSRPVAVFAPPIQASVIRVVRDLIWAAPASSDL
jgi:hypothetical protein